VVDVRGPRSLRPWSARSGHECQGRRVRAEERGGGGLRHAPWEGHEVDGELAQVAVELPGEAEGAGGAGDGGGHQVVEVAVGGRGELERAEADVVERLVVQREAVVRVLDQLQARVCVRGARVRVSTCDVRGGTVTSIE
jgi:hypothetical protein